MATKGTRYNASDETALIRELIDPQLTPLEFVMMVYPWGQSGTILQDIKSPRNWQIEVLEELGDYIKTANRQHALTAQLPDYYRHAIASGRGIGKSAMLGWLAHWMVSTRLGSSVWITANGEPQLRTKTFPELSIWFSLALNSHWWQIESMSIRPAEWYADAVKRGMGIETKYYYVSGQLWNASNPSAFAGAHNQLGEMALFDEASGIPAPIWGVQEGVFTERTVDRYWFAISNPREASGAFFECFHAQREMWRTKQIDARTVDGVDRNTYDNIIKKHGEDSFEARVEVYGQFPEQGQNQFISRTLAANALSRECGTDPGAPLVMGVDVARFGDDSSVICFRRGRDARSIPWFKVNGWSTTQLTAKVAELATQHDPQAIFVDGGGVGGGVVDQLKGLDFRVIEVQSGESAENKDKYQNKRAEMWDRMREWLAVGAIPDAKGLVDDLCNLEYGYTTTNQIKLERKDELKKRGYASPDLADALALTFARTVARTDLATHRSSRRVAVAKGLDYNLLG